MQSILKVENLSKRFKEFELKDISFELPKGYNIGLIGTNGAGKTTLMDLIMGFQKKSSGSIKYFNKFDSSEEAEVKNCIGYISDSIYFYFNWKVKNVARAMKAGFDNFDIDKFYEFINKFEISEKKTIASMSKGTKMKLMLAAQFARDTKLLIMDEPAAPLDPVMREELCDLFRDYIKDGEKTIFFSTHNIADMENTTDYVIIMKDGRMIEQGFVEELKEKYVVIRGDIKDIEKLRKYFINVRVTEVGFEGYAYAKDIKELKTFIDAAIETPSLQQISIMLLKSEKLL